MPKKGKRRTSQKLENNFFLKGRTEKRYNNLNQLQILVLCLWHVNRNEVTKWRNDEFLNFHATYFLKYKTESAKTVQRQLHILHNISKFRHFVISSHLLYWHANHINIEKQLERQPKIGSESNKSRRQLISEFKLGVCSWPY